MKTGIADRPLTRASTGIALTAVLALPLVLSGCDDHSPVAAPTSTLPAGEASQTPSPADAEPNIPAYETDLDLSAEETKAVEGALVAFEGYIATINRAYSGEFDRIDDFPKYTSGEALASIKAEANSIQSQQATFDGEIDPLSVEIFEVGTSAKDQSSSRVTVHFCVDTRNWSLTQAGKEPTENPDGLVTMEHKILLEGDAWMVDKQSLWERKC